MNTVIEAIDLHQHYGRQPVLQGLDCRIAAGEFFIVIGPNGSGKTTLLKTLAGILKPHRGEVTILDRPLGRHSRAALARQVALRPEVQRPEHAYKYFVTNVRCGSSGLASALKPSLAASSNILVLRASTSPSMTVSPRARAIAIR